jgi:hypothetical protein
VDDPNTVLAGAKIPVSRIRSFPVRFRLTAANALTGQEGTWADAVQDKDVTVRAVVCDREVDLAEAAAAAVEAKHDRNSMLSSCKNSNGKMIGGQGTAKLLRLQLQDETIPTILRAPASVALQ